MTLLRDQLTALADSVATPPAPSILDLERRVISSRPQRRWAILTAAAVVALVVGVAAWWTRPDRAVEPAPAPGWSDLDVPYTANGRLHWRTASIPVTGVVAVAPARDVIFVWNDNAITMVRPDGSTEPVAARTEGLMIADPDGTMVVWRSPQGIAAYDAVTGPLGSLDDPSPSDQIIPWDVSGGVVYASARDGALTWEPSSGPGQPSMSSGARSGLPVVAARAGWQLRGTPESGPVAVGPAGQRIHLPGDFRGFGFSPGGGHAAELRDQPTVTDLATGKRTVLALPGGAVALELRWIDRSRLLVAVVLKADQGTDDEPVHWQLCSAPDWSCAAPDLPAQPRAEVAYQATAWTWLMAFSEPNSSGGSSAGPAVSVQGGGSTP